MPWSRRANSPYPGGVSSRALDSGYADPLTASRGQRRSSVFVKSLSLPAEIFGFGAEAEDKADRAWLC